MAGYWCESCYELGTVCKESNHMCLCGSAGLVHEDGWVECEACVRKRLKEMYYG